MYEGEKTSVHRQSCVRERARLCGIVLMVVFWRRLVAGLPEAFVRPCITQQKTTTSFFIHSSLSAVGRVVTIEEEIFVVSGGR